MPIKIGQVVKKIAGCFDYKKHESKEESKVMIAS